MRTSKAEVLVVPGGWVVDDVFLLVWKVVVLEEEMEKVMEFLVLVGLENIEDERNVDGDDESRE